MVEVLAREKIGMIKKVTSQIMPGAKSRYGVIEWDLMPLLGPE
jgi:hypothetical protein